MTDDLPVMSQHHYNQQSWGQLDPRINFILVSETIVVLEWKWERFHFLIAIEDK